MIVSGLLGGSQGGNGGTVCSLFTAVAGKKSEGNLSSSAFSVSPLPHRSGNHARDFTFWLINDGRWGWVIGGFLRLPTVAAPRCLSPSGFRQDRSSLHRDENIRRGWTAFCIRAAIAGFAWIPRPSSNLYRGCSARENTSGPLVNQTSVAPWIRVDSNFIKQFGRRLAHIRMLSSARKFESKVTSFHDILFKDDDK